jgi:hypothetical protein
MQVQYSSSEIYAASYLFFYGEDVAGEVERDLLSFCALASEVTASNRQQLSQYQRFAEGIGRVLAPLL